MVSANVKRIVGMVAHWLVILGAIVWGLVGLFDFNLVERLLPVMAKFVYVLVGVSGVYLLLERLKVL